MNSLGFDKKNSDTKVIVAMSGGVDSSVAAAILKQEGYNIKGITLRLYSQVNRKSTKSCCAGRDIEDAKKVAEQIGFPHLILDYQDKFFSGVIDEGCFSIFCSKVFIPSLNSSLVYLVGKNSSGVFSLF